jgi:hypothetical protein
MLLRVLRDVIFVRPQTRTAAAPDNVGGTIEVAVPGGATVRYTPSEKAEGAVDFGAGFGLGALVFGATGGIAVLAGLAVAGLAYLAQPRAKPDPAAPPLPVKE